MRRALPHFIESQVLFFVPTVAKDAEGRKMGRKREERWGGRGKNDGEGEGRTMGREREERREGREKKEGEEE